MLLSTGLLRTTDRYIAKLAEAGVRTVEDFVTLYPREHKDKANVITAFAHVNLKEPNTVRATLESLAAERTRFGKQLVKAVIRDQHGTLAEAVWFNQPYLARQYHAGDEVVLYGKAKYGYGKLSFVSPDLTLAADASAIEPVYSDTNTVPGHWIGSKMPLLRAHMRELPDLVPEAIRVKR